VVFILGLCAMLLRRHRECRTLVHRVASRRGQEEESLDTFDPDTDDPTQAFKDGEHPDPSPSP
jgi:hypothetical protein